MKTKTYPFPLNKPVMNIYQKQAQDNAAALLLAKQEDREYRALLLERAKEEGVGVVHVFDEFNHWGGLTIAFKPSTEHKSCTMVDVAVNTCSKEDAFSRTIGTKGALEKFFAGITIQLPLIIDGKREDLNGTVKGAFNSLYFYHA